MHWKDWCWSSNSNTLATWCKELSHLKKTLMAGKDWRRKEKETTEDEMVGWHHWLNGHEFEQAPGAGDGQGSLVCCSPWGCQESDSTERLNWTDNHITFAKILPHSLSCTSHSMNTQSPHHIWWVLSMFFRLPYRIIYPWLPLPNFCCFAATRLAFSLLIHFASVYWLKMHDTACKAGAVGATGLISGSEDLLEKEMANHPSIIS